MTDEFDIRQSHRDWARSIANRESEEVNKTMSIVADRLGAQPIPALAMAAALKLRDSISARPSQRHVRVETTVAGTGEFTYTLVASVDPSSGVAVLLSEVDGFPVRNDPWPTR